MAKKHAQILDGVLGDIGNQPNNQVSKAGEARGAQGSGRFTARRSVLADRLSGATLEKTQRWVDPSRCRMWSRHNRQYDLLNEHRCRDLIEGFKAQGQQEFPAIVREVPDDPDFDYEVICGARRHWTVSWLRNNNYPKFQFLIEVRELTDEEAFRLSDIENRDREDISDLERARDYAQALTAFYEGSQKEMAARIEVSEAWLSRYLALNKLPAEIIEAFSDTTEIRERHARTLLPLLSRREQKERVLDEARRLATFEAQDCLEAKKTVECLVRAANAKKQTSKVSARDYEVTGYSKSIRAKKARGKNLILEIPNLDDADAILEACRRAIDDFLSSKSS